MEAKFADMLVLPFLSHCHHLYPIHAGIHRYVTIYWSAFEVVIRWHVQLVILHPWEHAILQLFQLNASGATPLSYGLWLIGASTARSRFGAKNNCERERERECIDVCCSVQGRFYICFIAIEITGTILKWIGTCLCHRNVCVGGPNCS